MTSLPRISPQKSIILTLEPLTPSSFAPFGTVITSPLPQDLTTIPPSPPQAIHSTHQPNPQFANQKTALKTSPISPLVNNYPTNTSTPGTGLMSIFSCFPRRLTNTNDTSTKSNNGKKPTLSIPIPILERHPYTTQTFCPFNFSLPSSSTTTTTTPTTSSQNQPQQPNSSQTYFLVVVAPTITSKSSDADTKPINPPSLSGLRAFYSPIALNSPLTSSASASAPALVTAVTYNAATWHAPMIVTGSRRVDFLVTQFANGVGEDDCQEVLIGNGNDVVVDLSRLDIGTYSTGGSGIKAKL